MLRTALLAAGFLMSLGVYIPLFKRILKRRHTRDYSKESQWFVVAAQCNGLILATAEHSIYFQIWYVIQILLSTTQLLFIYRWWNTLPPIMRDRQ
jgi:hypothetical protein